MVCKHEAPRRLFEIEDLEPEPESPFLDEAAYDLPTRDEAWASYGSEPELQSETPFASALTPAEQEYTDLIAGEGLEGEIEPEALEAPVSEPEEGLAPLVFSVRPQIEKLEGDEPQQVINGLIDKGLSEKDITNEVFFQRNPKLRGQELRKGTRQAQQWRSIRDSEVRPAAKRLLGSWIADPVLLATFFSQYEGDSRVPANATQQFLTRSPLLSMGRTLRDRVLSQWRWRNPPLTLERLYQLAYEISGHPSSAMLLCHNVTKAFARGGTAISWDRVPTAPETYSDGKNTWTPKVIHSAGRLTKTYSAKYKRDLPSIYYLLFSEKEFGTDDPGDWYHYYVAATMTAYGAAGDLSPSAPVRELEERKQPVGGVIEKAYPLLVRDRLLDLESQMSNPDLVAAPGYRGWVLANVVSFLEGGHYGDKQADVARESRFHLRGALAGLRTAGLKPGKNWVWYVPGANSLSKEDLVAGFLLQYKTAEVLDANGQRFRPPKKGAKPTPETFEGLDDAELDDDEFEHDEFQDDAEASDEDEFWGSDLLGELDENASDEEIEAGDLPDYTGHEVENLANAFSEAPGTLHKDEIEEEFERSREWELARRLAMPEDSGQIEFVRWLERPIAASDKKAITERYQALRILFGTMGPSAARRMHERLTDSRDPLGELARLELADWHRNYLIQLAATRARAVSGGIRGTTPPPDLPKSPDIIGGRPPYIPPPIPAPKPTPTPVEPTKPIPVEPTKPTSPKITGGTPPKFQPKSIYTNIDPAAPSWLASSLSGVAKMAGVGISILVAVIPGGVLEKAVQAAWLVYQLERLPARALVGLAGERAAEMIAAWILEEKMGIPVSKIIDLNLVEKSFTGLDLLAPDLPISVKTFGVLSNLTGDALRKSLLSRYKSEALYLFDTNHSLHIRYQEKIGDKLLKYRQEKLQNVWPSSLSGRVDSKKVAQFVRDKGVMMIPDDHVTLVRSHMGAEYFAQYQEGKLAGFKPGLPDEVIAPQISDLCRRRFISSGLKTSDYRAIADVAGRLPEARNAVVKRGRKSWPKDWGDPPTWTGTVMRP